MVSPGASDASTEGSWSLPQSADKGFLQQKLGTNVLPFIEPKLGGGRRGRVAVLGTTSNAAGRDMVLWYWLSQKLAGLSFLKFFSGGHVFSPNFCPLAKNVGSRFFFYFLKGGGVPTIPL